jgi:hypothetical protein
MKKTAVYKWVKCFSEGRESVTDEERSEWPSACCSGARMISSVVN